jgi:hypothetical protein
VGGSGEGVEITIGAAGVAAVSGLGWAETACPVGVAAGAASGEERVYRKILIAMSTTPTLKAPIRPPLLNSLLISINFNSIPRPRPMAMTPTINITLGKATPRKSIFTLRTMFSSIMLMLAVKSTG